MGGGWRGRPEDTAHPLMMELSLSISRICFSTCRCSSRYLSYSCAGAMPPARGRCGAAACEAQLPASARRAGTAADLVQVRPQLVALSLCRCVGQLLVAERGILCAAATRGRASVPAQPRAAARATLAPTHLGRHLAAQDLNLVLQDLDLLAHLRLCLAAGLNQVHVLVPLVLQRKRAHTIV